MSNFFFFHNVFKSRLLQRRQKASVWWKRVNLNRFNPFPEELYVFIRLWNRYRKYRNCSSSSTVIPFCGLCPSLFKFTRRRFFQLYHYEQILLFSTMYPMLDMPHPSVSECGKWFNARRQTNTNIKGQIGACTYNLYISPTVLYSS